MENGVIELPVDVTLARSALASCGRIGGRLAAVLEMCLLTVCSALCAVQVSAQELHSHPVPEKLGTVTFPTSCAPGVGHEFGRAVALLHSFAYDASEQAFQAIAVADPTCAMAHWGVAMSYFHQLWSPPDPADLRKGRAETGQAILLGGKTPRERQFIAAAATYYRDSDHLTHPTRAQAYADAMAEVAHDNPKDTEAQVFYALALIAVAPPEDHSHADQKRAAALLEPVFRDQPDHPGAAHYLIHAYDSTELAPRGLAAARAYSKIAPSAAHALHMPSHIFTRLGLWEDSIISNQAARQAAHEQGDVGEELHAMDYLAYAYLQRGRDTDAEQVGAALRVMTGLLSKDFKVGYAATAIPVRLTIERRRWGDAALLQPLPDSAPNVASIVYWARAVANARAGRPQTTDADMAKIETCRQQLQATGNTYWATQTEILGKEAKSWQLAASGRVEEATQLLRHAADEEEALEKLPVTPGPIVPAREQLGEMLLTRGRSREALQEFRIALIAAPRRRAALTGAIQAAELAGDRPMAEKMRADLASE
jgi:tetratricopeptide (TPR) repeat protein